MQCPDVNILIYAFRKDTEPHAPIREWLHQLLRSNSPFALCEVALCGFLRITTNRRIFKEPNTLSQSVQFCEALRQHPHCRIVTPSPRHWSLFLDCANKAQARGGLIQDAWFAALAIDHGLTWITTDRDYAKFPQLQWRHPLEDDTPQINP